TGAYGLIIDSEGRLYALTAAGVEIFSPQGKQLGIIQSTCLATIKIARALPSVVRRKARYMSPVVVQSGKLRCFRPDSKAGRSKIRNRRAQRPDGCSKSSQRRRGANRRAMQRNVGPCVGIPEGKP